MRRVLILVLLVALGLSAELWVNAIRDPGAELGQGDWETDIWELHEGDADSAVVSVHDSTRAYEGEYSFLTDTKTNPNVGPSQCYVRCVQNLKVPKAVSDIDSCFWVIHFQNISGYRESPIYVGFLSKEERNIRWVTGNYDPVIYDTLFWVEFPLPDSAVWTEHGGNFYEKWTGAAGWSALDTIVQVHLHTWWTESEAGFRYGQEVSWDNIVLRTIAYYDYATESIDSDPWEDTQQPYVPIATFSNKGKLNDFSTYVYAEIYRSDTEAVVYKDSVEINIASDDSQQVIFATYLHEPDDAEYSLRVFPILENDELSADDTLEMVLTASVTEEPIMSDLINTRRIDTGVLFSFTPEISGQLSIYDASGRQVFKTSIASGTPELIWSTNEVSSGLYFYRFNSPGLTVTDKLVVLQ